MSTPKPSVLLVHGAFHPPACYDPLTRELEAAGFEVVAPRLPSLGDSVEGVTLDEDVAAVHSAAAPLFAAGKGVILIGHSYGGFVVNIVAKDHTAEQRRAEGLGAGGFVAAVFLCGTLASKGRDTSQSTNPRVIDVLDVDMVRIKSSIKKGAEAAAAAFYHEPAPQDAIERCLKLLEPHCAGPFMTPTPVEPADLTIPLTYVVCEKDSTVLLASQERILAEAPKMRAVRLPDAGHSAFLSHPKRVAEIVVEVASDLASI